MPETLAEALRKLQPIKRGRGRLKPPAEREAIAASVATIYPSTGNVGSGIASPLTEDDTLREYHALDSITSSDGLFVIEFYPYSKRVFDDANSEQVVFNLAEPDE